MKNTYIARQAILNNNLDTIGYELFFRDSPENKFPDIDTSLASSRLVIQHHIYGDIETLGMGKLAFINFTEHSLINKYPLMFDNKTIVIEIVGQKKPTEKLLKIIKYYHKQGYKIALTEYDLSAEWNEFFPYIAIIKINIEEINPKRIITILPKIKQHNIKLAAERVETKHQQQSLTEVGFSFFQGYFYHKPELIKDKKLTSLKTQMLQLLSESHHTPINYDKVADIISHDVNLTIGLLKMVNNVTTGARVEITSLKQAAVYLGDDKLCQFIAILALSNLTTDNAGEVCRLALITGKMMAELSQYEHFIAVNNFAFITGLLSFIEVILSMPAADVLKTMPLAEPITSALLTKQGLLGELLTFTTSYIAGNDDNIAQSIYQYRLDKKAVQQAFINASQWCNDLGV